MASKESTSNPKLKYLQIRISNSFNTSINKYLDKHGIYNRNGFITNCIYFKLKHADQLDKMGILCEELYFEGDMMNVQIRTTSKQNDLIVAYLKNYNNNLENKNMKINKTEFIVDCISLVMNLNFDKIADMINRIRNY